MPRSAGGPHARAEMTDMHYSDRKKVVRFMQSGSVLRRRPTSGTDSTAEANLTKAKMQSHWELEPIRGAERATEARARQGKIY